MLRKSGDAAEGRKLQTLGDVVRGAQASIQRLEEKREAEPGEQTEDERQLGRLRCLRLDLLGPGGRLDESGAIGLQRLDGLKLLLFVAQ